MIRKVHKYYHIKVHINTMYDHIKVHINTMYDHIKVHINTMYDHIKIEVQFIYERNIMLALLCSVACKLSQKVEFQQTRCYI